MKLEKGLTIIGMSMFIAGLVMFYLVDLTEMGEILKIIKNIGTFVGLSGMGVTLAGILLIILNKNEPPIKESFGV
jgi:hypothetical protein